MTLCVKSLRILLVLLGFLLPLSLKGATATPNPVKATLIAEESTIQAGRPFWVALHLQLEEGWHVYWKNPGDAGLPLKVQWKLPNGFHATSLLWPFPEKLTLDDLVGYGYHSEVVLLTEVTPPSDLTANSEITLDTEVKWLVCSTTACLPGSAPLKLKIKTSSETPEIDQKAAALFQSAREKMPKSGEQIKTVQKEGIIQVKVPHLDDDAIAGISFFPEDNETVDQKFEPVVSQDKSSKKGYLISLKGGEEIGAKVKNLKGVLVIHTKKDNGSYAIDIDTPILEENDAPLIGYAEVKKEFGSSRGVHAVPAGSTFEGGVALALLFAFLGGIILNLMPCVLPVISLKVMSFVKMAGQKRSLTIKHSLLFSFGVIISFWVLASLMLMLRSYGQAVGWGFQLQEPLFVAALAALLFVLALGLFGVFEWGLSVASWAGQTEADKAKGSSSYTASFLSGVMATAVATPCTGPFLGSAVGFAVSLPVFQALLIFTALGVGMALPYLLLAMFPVLLRFIPKPGPWMKTFKELMGFLLMATVLWLLWVFSAQTNSMSLVCLLGAFLILALASWVYGIGSGPMVSKKKRLLAYAMIAILVVASVQIALLPKATWAEDNTAGAVSKKGEWSGWENFSPERVAQLQKEGTPYIIDFTAKWCLICQANHLVLASPQVTKKMDEAGVVRLKADWTKNDPVITAELNKMGRNSVPLYVFHGGDSNKEPVILPQVLTPDSILPHLESLDTGEIADSNK